MGAGSMGQTATIWANSAANTPLSETAPEFAALLWELWKVPVFSGGVPVLSSPNLDIQLEATFGIHPHFFRSSTRAARSSGGMSVSRRMASRRGLSVGVSNEG